MGRGPDPIRFNVLSVLNKSFSSVHDMAWIRMGLGYGYNVEIVSNTAALVICPS